MSKYDYNIVVIGAGSGGLVSSLIAAGTQAKVALIEADKMGGDCLNTGCVPSKALIKVAKTVYEIQQADKYGIHCNAPEVDFQAVMQHVHNAIKTIEPHDSIERFTQLGVDCFQGHAFIEDPHHVRIGEQILSTKNIIIATGAKASVPDISGLSQVDYLTSDNLWQLQKLPKKLLILGAGPIGVEMAQAFQRLGSEVTLADRNSRLLKVEDNDVSEHLLQQFESEGIHCLLNHQLSSMDAQRNTATFICHDEKRQVSFDKVLICLGRSANISGFGLEALGVEINAKKRIQSNAFLQTNIANIFVCGDVTGPYQFTHAASHQAWTATVNALFSPLKRFKINYDNMAWCTFVDPQIARLGINEQEAQQQSIAYEVSRYDFADLDRAICEGKNQGFIKVLNKPGSDKILGVSIVAEHAGELLAEFALAKTHGLGLNKILSTLHIYPSWSEANKFVAGEWRKKHIPAFALTVLNLFHQLRKRL